MLQREIFLPIIVFIVTSYMLYSFSNDPDKKSKPLQFIVPGGVASAMTFAYFKFNRAPERMMEGNYFD